MRREIKKAVAHSQKIPSEGFAENPAEWLRSQAAKHNLDYLLAHADDGVIWGRCANHMLTTSHELEPDISPELRAKTLQTARLFSRNGELLIWRDASGGWIARLIREAEPGEISSWTEAYDEEQILWGTSAEAKRQGFSLMSDGVQGLRHVVPKKLQGEFGEEGRPLRLVIRHYVQDDERGFTRVIASRLYDLLPEEATA